MQNRSEKHLTPNLNEIVEKILSGDEQGWISLDLLTKYQSLEKDELKKIRGLVDKVNKNNTYRYSNALVLMGYILWNEDNSKQNPVEFYEEELKLDKENSSAQHKLALFYLQNGDKNKALDLLNQAKENNNSQAILTLAQMAQPNFWAIHLYEKAVDLGNSEAMVRLAYIYEKGEVGQQQDPQEAIKLLEKAKDLGHSGALVRCGMLYESGEQGYLQDSNFAIKLYELAMTFNSFEGISKRALHYTTGKGSSINLNQAAHLFYRAYCLNKNVTPENKAIAINNLKKLAKHRGVRNAQKALILIAIDEGQFEKAKKLFKQWPETESLLLDELLTRSLKSISEEKTTQLYFFGLQNFDKNTLSYFSSIFYSLSALNAEEPVPALVNFQESNGQFRKYFKKEHLFAFWNHLASLDQENSHLAEICYFIYLNYKLDNDNALYSRLIRYLRRLNSYQEESTSKRNDELSKEPWEIVNLPENKEEYKLTDEQLIRAILPELLLEFASGSGKKPNSKTRNYGGLLSLAPIDEFNRNAARILISKLKENENKITGEERSCASIIEEVLSSEIKAGHIGKNSPLFLLLEPFIQNYRPLLLLKDSSGNKPKAVPQSQEEQFIYTLYTFLKKGFPTRDESLITLAKNQQEVFNYIQNLPTDEKKEALGIAFDDRSLLNAFFKTQQPGSILTHFFATNWFRNLEKLKNEVIQEETHQMK